MTDYAKNMKKYKEISQKRIRRKGLMKIKLQELDRCKADGNTEAKITFKSSYRVHDREVADHGPLNPFHVPPHRRTFGGTEFKREVKKAPFIMSEPHTICDVDENFYKIIEGRPLREFVDVKRYIRDIRDITLNRANAAYLKDNIVLINNSYAYENQEYDKILKLYYKTKENFVTFAKESYVVGQRAQEKAEVKAKELKAMEEQLNSFSFEFVRIRNEIGNLVVIFETLHLYCRFLYTAAPLKWRELYDEEFSGYNYYFEKLDKDLEASDMSFDEYQKSVVAFEKFSPRLYFQRPSQLIKLFDFIGKQCLNYMQINVFSSSILNSVLKSRDYLKRLAVEEITKMQDMIELYTKKLKWMEEQEVIFKKRFENLLMTKFYELYASYDSSKLFTCVQYVNTQIYNNPEDPKDSVYILAQQLEDLYISLTSGLDDLNQEVVHAATKEFFAEDLKTMKTAFSAQRQLREWNILTKALYASFEPPRYKKMVKKEQTTRKSKMKI